MPHHKTTSIDRSSVKHGSGARDDQQHARQGQADQQAGAEDCGGRSRSRRRHRPPSNANDRRGDGPKRNEQQSNVSTAQRTKNITIKEQTDVNAQLSAVVKYLTNLKDRCVAKAMTNREESQRRAAEIANRKEFSILSASEFRRQPQTLYRISAT